MTAASTSNSLRLRSYLFLRAHALPAVLILASLAVANRSAAGQFAVPTLTPNSQTVNVGTPFSVDIGYNIGSIAAYGVDMTLTFDPTLLQISAVTPDASSPFSSVTNNTFNNTLGILHYTAFIPGTQFNYGNPGSIGGGHSVATIDFLGIADGTSILNFASVNEYLFNYGQYGANGTAGNGSVTVEGSGPPPVAAPDGASTLGLLGSGLLALAALRRRHVSA
jgi:VPDSG-CTERM motif/Cohesin domain